MEFILLKSSLCLLSFITFYKVLLERTSNHQFKRYYLLCAVIISIAIPFITFIEYIEPQTILNNLSIIPNTSEMATTTSVETINYLPIILWSIYGLGVIVFTFRFVFNLKQIFQKIKRNPKQKTYSIINVLLQDTIVPHTFFNYIFLNKTKFENKEIPKEVLLHEETHAKQKHSLDILFIELLQIIFWFHPLVYLLKRDMKLNHEFLADQAVINQGANTAKYQNLLLAYSSHAAINPMAHAINYSLIKKRFTVMKTKTSKQSLWLRSLLVFPLLGVLIYGFSTTKQIEKNTITTMPIEDSTNSINNSNHTARSISIKVFSNGTYKIDGIEATKKTFSSVINQLHQDISPEIRNRIMNIHINSEKDIPNKEVWFIYNAFSDYGFHRIVTDNQEIIREKGNKPFAVINDTDSEQSKAKIRKTTQQQATPKQVAEYNKIAAYYNKMIHANNGIRIKSKDVERLKYIYDIMSVKQRENAEPFPDFPKPPPAPKVKKENASIIPPPPPPIPANATPEQKVKYAKAHEEYNRKYEVINGEVEKRVPPPPPPIPANATPEQRKKMEAARTKHEKARKEAMIARKETRELAMVSRKKEMAHRKKEREHVMDMRREEMTLRKEERNLAMKERKLAMKERQLKMERDNIPPPPPPKSPLDHVIEMAKKDATFYYEGKKISSDEAIKILKKDQDLNISTKKINSNNPIVYITTQPVITDENGKVVTKIERLSDVKSNTKKDRHGYVDINGTTYFYSVENHEITYFNRWGKKVNEKGELIH